MKNSRIKNRFEYFLKVENWSPPRVREDKPALGMQEIKQQSQNNYSKNHGPGPDKKVAQALVDATPIITMLDFAQLSGNLIRGVQRNPIQPVAENFGEKNMAKFMHRRAQPGGPFDAAPAESPLIIFAGIFLQFGYNVAQNKKQAEKLIKEFLKK